VLFVMDYQSSFVSEIPGWVTCISLPKGFIVFADVCNFLPKWKLQLIERSPTNQRCLHTSTQLIACLFQAAVVVDAKWVNIVLGNQEGLSKGLEPDNADEMISVNGHRSLFSSETNSPYWKLIRKGTAGAFQSKNIK
jgi:hypothetical protein